ncbi:MAG TPA: VWA domain-containing protein [Pyrinomonadaceae bacterium]|jgi:VWFA-related protein
MYKRSSLTIVLVLSLFGSIIGQSPTGTPVSSQANSQQPTQGTTREEDEVVRITSNLVQVDAVVTDQKGMQVTDLGPEDFEIFEDKRPQKITNFSYVSNVTATTTTANPSATARDKTGPPVPPVRLRPEQVRRTIALVVDDLGLSFESIYYVRRALKRFVDEQMQPTDLVAIIRTGSGMGALQQFTSDKRQLNAAIERMRWNPMGRAGVGSFAPIGSEPSRNDSATTDAQKQSNPGGMNPNREGDQFREEIFTVGTLGALNYIIRGLKELPGRKSVLLLTDGFKIFNTVTAPTLNRPDGGTRGAGDNDRVLEALRRLIDLANRASVVIYSMDPRGLPTLGLTAEDNTADLNEEEVRSAVADRRDSFIQSQEGPAYLSRQTGGFYIRNTNDLSKGMRQVLDDQKGYYLIGYRPDEATFDAKTGSRRFHNISVKVKRAGLRVRTRNGFYGVVNEEARAVPRTRVAQLTAALTSPFNSNGIDLRLTSFFGNDAQTGSFVRSLLHIDGRDVTFTKDAEGWQQAVLDVLVLTYGESGTIVDQITNTYTVRVRGKTYERILKNGFVYTITLPVKKAGAYQLRAALRDSTSERVGSASQFIEVPDINKRRLTLSGIIVTGVESDAAAAARSSSNQGGGVQAGAAGTPATTAPAEGEAGAEQAESQATPSMRLFKRGMVLQYDYLIFNAQVDKATPRPQLQTQVRLFRDGQPIFEGNPKPFDASGQTDLKRLVAGGALRLGTDMTPGEYVLQVVVTDMLAQDKYRTATQWIDFEIAK